MRPFVAIAMVLATAACGGEGTATGGSGGDGGSGAAGGSVPTEGCAPGELLVDESCRPAGLPEGWTEPGPPADLAPGVVDCGVGFTGDALGGCEPILPATPCTGATMAVPGDSMCRPVADCGAAPWGSIPVDATTLYVDGSFTGAPDGSANAPYPTIQQAVDVAAAGTIVAIAAGTYVEDVAIDGTPVALWGRCPELVEIVGSASDRAVGIWNAPGAEVHQVAVTGPQLGIAILDAPSVLIDRVYVHDTTEPGIGAVVQGDEPRIVDSLVENAGIAAILTQGALGVERTEVRSNDPSLEGLAIAAWPNGAPVSLRVEGSHLHDLVGGAIAASSASVQITNTFITHSSAGAIGFGRGIELNDDELGTPSVAEIEATVIRDVELAGIVSFGSIATVRNTTVGQIAAGNTGFGSGISAVGSGATGAGSDVAVSRSVVRDTIGHALDASISTLAVDETLIQRSLPETIDGNGGRGISGYFSASLDMGPIVQVERCLVEDMTDQGIIIAGGTLTVRDSIVRRVAHPGELAVGVMAESGSTGVPATALVETTRIEDVAGFGAYAYESTLELNQVAIAGVTGTDTLFDAGAAVGTIGERFPATLTLRDVDLGGDINRGVLTVNTEVDITAMRLRDTVPTSLGPGYGDGRGLELQGSTGFVSWSEVAGSASVGFVALSSDVELEGVAIVNTRVDLAGEPTAAGFAVAESSGAASATLRGCRVEAAAGVGIIASSAELTVQHTLVRGLLPTEEGRFGRGIIAQEGSSLDVSDTRVEGAYDIGLHLLQSTGSIRRTTIAGVDAAIDDGLYGDGLSAMACPMVTLDELEVSDVARAAVSSFGSHVAIRGSDLRCNDLALALEPLDGVDATMENLGDNRCGCEAEAPCKALSAGLTPPEAYPNGM